MRILHVGKYYPPHKGGMETVLRQICEGLLARGHDVRALVAGTSLVTTRGALAGGRGRLLRVATWGTIESQPVMPTLPFVLAAEIADFAPDVVHLHLPNPVACAAWRLVASLRRRGTTPALAVWYHADITRQRRLGRLVAPVVRRCLADAQGVCAATATLVHTSPTLASLSDRVTVVPYGIDASPFLDIPPADGGPLLFVGRLVAYKGLTTLIEAVGGLEEVALEIAGTGPLAAALAGQIARGGWQDRIRLLGEVPDDDLPRRLARCRALVLPSLDRSEAFGICLLEAMAAGRPVVTSALESGVLEVNEPGVTGWAAPPGDAVRLREAVRELYADPDEARRRGAAGRQRVLARFRTERLAADLEAWYGNLAG